MDQLLTLVLVLLMYAAPVCCFVFMLVVRDQLAAWFAFVGAWIALAVGYALIETQGPKDLLLGVGYILVGGATAAILAHFMRQLVRLIKKMFSSPSRVGMGTRVGADEIESVSGKQKDEQSEF